MSAATATAVLGAERGQCARLRLYMPAPVHQLTTSLDIILSSIDIVVMRSIVGDG